MLPIEQVMTAVKYALGINETPRPLAPVQARFSPTSYSITPDATDVSKFLRSLVGEERSFG